MIKEQRHSPIFVGLSGKILSENERQLLTIIRPAGIVLFARNFENPDQLKKLIISIRELNGEDTQIAVDHEGGRVVRFPTGSLFLPSAQQLGAERNPEQVQKMSRDCGEILRAMGITMNLAPVLDVISRGAHPCMTDRCFGSDPKLVAELGIAFIRGMNQAGIQCTAKHFPGLGSALEDTHENGTTIQLSLRELEAHWYPFFRAVKENVHYIMINHARYSAIDPVNPAIFSAKCIDILRQDIGFSGKIISDDLEMKAISRAYSIEESTKKSLQAGCDIVSICQSSALQLKAYEAIINLEAKAESRKNLRKNLSR